MVYQVNQPIATDKLSVSAPILQGNTNAANTAFGFDHNPFTATSQIGYHTKVTMQPRSHPSATSGQAIIYAAQDSTNLGVLDYSLGSTAGFRTPLTFIQNTSPVTVPTTTPYLNVFDFTGLSFVVFNIFVVSSTATVSDFIAQATGFFNSSGSPQIVIRPPAGGSSYVFTSTGTILQLGASSPTINNVYYTIQFLRIS